MPLYEHACRKCDNEFELLIRADETPQCPVCESTRLERRLSLPAAHTSSARELPTCAPTGPLGCGLPQCGMGRCGLD